MRVELHGHIEWSCGMWTSTITPTDNGFMLEEWSEMMNEPSITHFHTLDEAFRVMLSHT